MEKLPLHKLFVLDTFSRLHKREGGYRLVFFFTFYIEKFHFFREETHSLGIIQAANGGVAPPPSKKKFVEKDNRLAR